MSGPTARADNTGAFPEPETMAGQSGLLDSAQFDRPFFCADALQKKAVPFSPVFFRLSTHFINKRGERDRALTALRSTPGAGYSLREAQNAPELTELLQDKRYPKIVGNPGSQQPQTLVFVRRKRPFFW